MNIIRRFAFLLGVFSWLTAAVAIGLSDVALGAKAEDAILASGNSSTNDTTLMAVAPPPFSKDIFPCSECHKPDDKVNRTPHGVDAHDNIVFEHDAKNRWCLDCHDAQQRDSLRLASGALLDFRESFKLCGQCHGDKLRDWKAGEHGKRTGSWDGKKQYLLCVHCHNPHSPRFKPLKPLPPPDQPGPLK